MKKYDIVIGAGCSFMDGAMIKNDKDELIGYNHLPIKYLSEKLNCNYLNLSKIGSSNDRILSSVFNYFEEVHDDMKKIVIIGLSGLFRMHLQPDVNFLPSYLIEIGKPKKILENYEGLTEQELKLFAKLCLTYFYDEVFLRKKLKERIKLLANYLDTKNIDYIIFNSLTAFPNLNTILPNKNTILFENQRDVWNEFLLDRHKKLTNEFPINYQKNLTSPHPPWGKYFCGDHPSPHANKDLADLLYKKIVNNGWID